MIRRRGGEAREAFVNAHALPSACAMAALAMVIPTAAAFARTPHETGILYRAVSVDGEKHRYAVYVPPDYDDDHDWPCVLFLHGSGECGRDGEKPTKIGLIPAILAHPERWSCVVVIPQKPLEDEEWEERESLVLATLKAARREFKIASDRVAFTGMSQGGHGVWMIAARHPKLFSCLVPLCGYGRARTVAPRVAELPVWAFHGLKDDLVNPEDTRHIMQAITEERTRRGLDPALAKMTLYPDVNHGVWEVAYLEPELPGWMLGQRRAEK